MPSILEELLEPFIQQLDDKARGALGDLVDGVSALSILQRLSSHKTEIRNPSAFVEKAVRNSGGGSATHQELQFALQRLQSHDLIDENASDALSKASTQDSCAAINGLLMQESGSVRNTSAYLTRNMVNARKGIPVQGAAKGGGKGGMMNIPPPPMPGMNIPPPPLPPGMNIPPNIPPQNVEGFQQGLAMGLQAAGCAGGGGFNPGAYGAPVGMPPSIMRWRSALDQKSLDSLQSVGVTAASEIIQELDNKGSSVRNPSAYVTRACENRIKEGRAGDGGGGDRGGDRGGSGGLFARYRGMLDEKALDSLRKVGATEATAILQNLDSRASTVRNPSAYVVRSVANFEKNGGVLDENAAEPDFADQILGSDRPGPPLGAFDFDTPIGGGPLDGFDRGGGGEHGGYTLVGTGGSSESRNKLSDRGLDEKAEAALAEVPHGVANTILQELESKSHMVQNRSAYVSRAVANAKKGEGRAASAEGGVTHGQGPGLISGYEHLTALIDERARSALEDQSVEVQSTILKALEDQGNKVQNPSAYVLKAVGNARNGKGQAGAVLTGTRLSHAEACPAEAAAVEAALAPWRAKLDEDAQRALEPLGLQAVQHILSELEQKMGSIRNPSAYVVRAVANLKQGMSPGPVGAGQNARPGNDYTAAVVEAELQEEMMKVGMWATLDDKALDALEQVGTRGALKVLRALNAQGGQVSNPNAYIMRGVANEKKASREQHGDQGREGSAGGGGGFGAAGGCGGCPGFGAFGNPGFGDPFAVAAAAQAQAAAAMMMAGYGGAFANFSAPMGQAGQAGHPAHAQAAKRQRLG